MSRLFVTLLCLLILADTGVLSIRFRFRVPRVRIPGTGYGSSARNKSTHTTGSPQLGVIMGVALGTILLVALVGSSGCVGGAVTRGRRSSIFSRFGNSSSG